MKQIIFKTDVSKIRSIRNSMSIHQKTNGTQVILSEANKIKIEQVSKLLSDAANLLETIV